MPSVDPCFVFVCMYTYTIIRFISLPLQEPPLDPSFPDRPLNDLQLSFVEQLNTCYPTALQDSRVVERVRIAGLTQAKAGSIMAGHFAKFLAD